MTQIADPLLYWKRRQLLSLVIMLSCVLGSSVWALWPITVPSMPSLVANADVTVEHSRNVDLKSWHVALAPLVASPALVAEATLTLSVISIIHRDQGAQAMIAVAGGPMYTVKIGSVIQEWKVLDIDAHSVLLTNDGHERRVELGK